MRKKPNTNHHQSEPVCQDASGHTHDCAKHSLSTLSLLPFMTALRVGCTPATSGHNGAGETLEPTLPSIISPYHHCHPHMSEARRDRGWGQPSHPTEGAASRPPRKGPTSSSFFVTLLTKSQSHPPPYLGNMSLDLMSKLGPGPERGASSAAPVDTSPDTQGWHSAPVAGWLFELSGELSFPTPLREKKTRPKVKPRRPDRPGTWQFHPVRGMGLFGLLPQRNCREPLTGTSHSSVGTPRFRILSTASRYSLLLRHREKSVSVVSPSFSLVFSAVWEQGRARWKRFFRFLFSSFVPRGKRGGR